MSDLILAGEISFWIALLMATWAAAVAFLGARLRKAELVESGERAMFVTAGLLALAWIGLLAALMGHDFSVGHVARFSASNLPRRYLVGALWAGPPGSLLFAGFLASLCCAAAVRRDRTRGSRSWTYAHGVMIAIVAALLAALAAGGGPLSRLDWSPPDGWGLNPHLQTPSFLLVAPALFAGYTLGILPFSRTLGALGGDSTEDMWATALRSAAFAWVLLVTGGIGAMWWSYLESGDMRNLALSPLTGGWLLPLSALGAALFCGSARAGGVQRNSARLLLMAVLPLSVLGWHATQNRVLHGTVSRVPPALLVLVGLCIVALGALVALRAASGEPQAVRTNRSLARGGRLLALLGVIILVLGVTVPAMLGRQLQLTLAPGEAAELRDPLGRTLTIASGGVSRYETLNRQVRAVTLSLHGEAVVPRVLTAEQRQYVDGRGAPTYEPLLTAATSSIPLREIHASLLEVKDDSVRLRIRFAPGVTLLWLGGAVALAGGLLLIAAQRPTRTRL